MSLYLKYRPQDFENLMWQSFVNHTLKKAIAENKTVGAYLLCGPRWTWKTTTARLLAKSLNCLDLKDGSPCLKCEICKDFVEEKLIDIIEIDAASHTWVDNIRDIIEKAQFRPTKTKYKVYIVDEVHMLSTGAFNALLKILEEPPEHVKFILATTETHKVPETIISRCQRYDFKRISNEDIIKRLSYIAEQESVTIDKESLDYIVKNAWGALRNAISLFEQLIEDNTIVYSRIVEKLEITGSDTLTSFMDKLVNGDSSVIDMFDTLVADGKNIKLFFKQLLYFIKDASLEDLKAWKDISRKVFILEKLDKTYTNTKHSLDEQMTFLIGLLQILSPESISVWSNIFATPVSLPVQNIPETKSSPVIQSSTETISSDDIMWVFWEESAPVVSSIPEKEISTNTSDFNVADLISKLKVLGAKWGLTMALRWSQMILRENNLHITTKTKIALGQIQNVDNQSLINQALSQMWVSDPQITF